MTKHLPVLFDETIEGLRIQPGQRFIDCTLGGGGHTAEILKRSAPDGSVLGLDADPEAIGRVTERFQTEIAEKRLSIVQENFGNVYDIAVASGFSQVDGILLDVGTSSFQLETHERGFSFMHDGPLDMRFDPQQPFSAATIVNEWAAHELADVIYQYGEERKSRRIAQFVVNSRPIYTTSHLAQIVEKAVGGRRGQRIHPATRTFQALRIAVNRELDSLGQALPQALQLLKSSGRLAVISFHSLEDRIVKQWIRDEARDYIQDKMHIRGGYERTPTLLPITRKPIVPTETEQRQNPRSRSAKLRIAEKINLNM